MRAEKWTLKQVQGDGFHANVKRFRYLISVAVLILVAVPHQALACRNSDDVVLLVWPVVPRKLPVEPNILLKVRLFDADFPPNSDFVRSDPRPGAIILEAPSKEIVGQVIMLPLTPLSSTSSCFQRGVEQGMGYVAGVISKGDNGVLVLKPIAFPVRELRLDH